MHPMPNMPEMAKKMQAILALRQINGLRLSLRDVQAVLPPLKTMRDAEKTLSSHVTQILVEEEKALLAAQPDSPPPPTAVRRCRRPPKTSAERRDGDRTRSPKPSACKRQAESGVSSRAAAPGWEGVVTAAISTHWDRPIRSDSPATSDQMVAFHVAGRKRERRRGSHKVKMAQRLPVHKHRRAAEADLVEEVALAVS